MKHYNKIYDKTINYFQKDDVHMHASTTGGMVVLWTGETFILYYTNKLLIV